MTDEVAGLPQGTLREIVLRLICPEDPPPLPARSAVSFREQAAVRPLRPAAGRRLSRSAEAVGLLERFVAQAPLLDELAGLFLAVAEAPPAAASLLNPSCHHLFVSGEVKYAFAIVRLGASHSVMERMMVQLVRGGYWREAEELARLLGRSLTGEEVLRLAESYTRGAVYSSELDEFWPQFAGRYLGPEGRRTVQQWVDQRNQRYFKLD